jgi:hypothetical protein
MGMLTTHKISADLYDDSFHLIAIHSDLEDYAMAYAINSHCGLYLKRMKKDLCLDENMAFSAFDWEDEMNDMYWTLIANKCETEEVMASIGLFENNVSKRIGHLVREKKEVDYFLKVDAVDETMFSEKLKTIKQIGKVITAYPLETQNLKSKRNLIF